MKNKSSSIAQETKDGPRTRIINSYLETIDKGIRKNRPQIKLINYGTGLQNSSAISSNMRNNQ